MGGCDLTETKKGKPFLSLFDGQSAALELRHIVNARVGVGNQRIHTPSGQSAPQQCSLPHDALVSFVSVHHQYRN